MINDKWNLLEYLTKDFIQLIETIIQLANKYLNYQIINVTLTWKVGHSELVGK